MRAASNATLVNAAATHAVLRAHAADRQVLVQREEHQRDERERQAAADPVLDAAHDVLAQAQRDERRAPLFVASMTYVLTVTLATNSSVDTTVIFTSKILPAMMPRSLSMSNTLASTVRSDPNRRVENQTKPMAL